VLNPAPSEEEKAMAGNIGNQPAAGDLEIDRVVQDASRQNHRVSVTTVAGDMFTETGKEVRASNGTVTIENADEIFVVPAHAVSSIHARP
jgi:hypothetical protein